MTYTISAQDKNGYNIQLKRSKETKDQVLFAAWKFSQSATLCYVVVKQGSKHLATYRRGVVTSWNGKEHKP